MAEGMSHHLLIKINELTKIVSVTYILSYLFVTLSLDPSVSLKGSLLFDAQVLFSLRLSFFFSGTSASDVHFQAYLLDGLMRWNADRTRAAVSSSESGPESYSGILIQAVNELSEDVLGRKIKSNVQSVGIYTGEQIGVEYLYSQTGEILKDNTLEDEDVRSPREEPLSDINPDQLTDEGFNEDEDETIAQAEQVFTVPLGGERGKCTFP